MSTQVVDLSESRGDVVLGTITAFTLWAICMVMLRFYVRIYIVRKIRMDDWLLLGALVFAVGEGAAICVEEYYGLGSHIQSISPAELVSYLKCLYISIVAYHASIALTKISLLIGYLHVFSDRWVRLASKISIGLVVLYWIYGILFMTLGCRPVSFFWDSSTPGGFCEPPLQLWLSHAAINMTTDIIIIIIPMPVLKSLNLVRQAKIWLLAVFGLGVIVIFISIIRIPSLTELAVSEDPSWDNVAAACWTQVETCIAIICATLPPLKALLKQHFPFLITADVHKTTHNLPSLPTLASVEEDAKTLENDASKAV